jgi:hypothetical protein
MSTITVIAAPQTQKRVDPERWHRARVRAAYLFAIAFVTYLLVIGFDYYRLPLSERPFSPQHDLLKPSGVVGLKLGIFGVLLFCGIFVYPLRKKWRWLQSIGTTKHWLDFHLVMGITAPWIIALHSSFRFNGFAGLAFWTMLMVALSGIVGRYLYAQIPRRVNSAELSLKDSVELQQYLVRELAEQSHFTQAELAPLLRVPRAERAHKINALLSLCYMIAIDLARPFRVASLRRSSLTPMETVMSLGGILRSNRADLELVIALARSHAALNKRIVFLSQAQNIFRLWHVIHRPFSITFIVFAIIHIGVVFLMGFAIH